MYSETTIKTMLEPSSKPEKKLQQIAKGLQEAQVLHETDH